MSDWITTLLHRAIEQTASGQGDWCVSLESKARPEHWVQLTAEFVNMGYPRTEEPAPLLARLLDTSDLDFDSYDASRYLTLAHSAPEDLTAIAEFIARYAEQVFEDPILPDAWKVREEVL